MIDSSSSVELLSDRFAFFDKQTILQQRTFLHDAAAGELPSFSWIDPNFVDLSGLTGANDDHPPTDVMAGQELVFKVYNAVVTSPLWERTLLLIIYDEHGGFYDPVSPPGGLPDKDRRFRRYGARVPVIVVSPWVEAQGHSHTVFDHTSIIKTALLHFCGSDAEEYIREMGPRLMQANHLGQLLTRDTPRTPPHLDKEKEIEQKELEKAIDLLVRWRAREIRRRLLHPLADEPSLIGAEAVQAGETIFGKLWNVIIEQVSRIFRRPRPPDPSKPPIPSQLEQPRHEFEQSMFTGAEMLRRRGLPTGHP